MTVTESFRSAVVVGAGPAGSLAAIHFARRGWSVQVIESRPDPRDRSRRSEGRSINLGLSARGLQALERVGLADLVRPLLVPMRGRAIHRRDGSLVLQAYGVRPQEQLYSVLRDDLNAVLLTEAARFPAVSLSFERSVTEVDVAGHSLTYDSEQGPQRLTADLIVGADGLGSVVRSHLLEATPGAEFCREDLPWGYKELTIPVGPGGTCQTDLEALHVWPGEKCLMVGHPNVDGSITCTLFLPHEGATSLATLRSGKAVDDFVASHLPDAAALMPNLAEEFLAHPTGHLSTIRTRPWHNAGNLVLVGDAAHAVYPFYGQGMNSALEDCTVLAECLDSAPDLTEALAEFERQRKPHLDVLAELSTANFEELRSHVTSPLFLLRQRLDLALYRLAPDHWRPLYTMVSHTTTPYADAVRRARWQDRLLNVAVAGLAGAGVLTAVAVVRRVQQKGRRP